MNKKEALYWILILTLSYGPTIGFHYLIRPNWYKGVDSFTSATTTEMFFTIVLLPVYLIVVNYLLAKKFGNATEVFVLNGMIILSCIVISTHLHFKNWADSIGSYDSPDFETLGVMDFERTAGIVVSLIGLVIVYLRIRNRLVAKQNNKVQ
jgi:hypothetical protein